MTALTALRTSEVTGARWSEIDLRAKVWTIPAERMKARVEHRVPLRDRVVEILRELPRVDGSDLVFADAAGNRPLRPRAMLDLMARMRPGFAPHGLRSSFRTWCAETTNFPRDLCEQALAHTVGSEVERSYQRGDLLEKRRALMADWARLLLAEAAGDQGHERHRNARGGVTMAEDQRPVPSLNEALTAFEEGDTETLYRYLASSPAHPQVNSALIRALSPKGKTKFKLVFRQRQQRPPASIEQDVEKAREDIRIHGLVKANLHAGRGAVGRACIEVAKAEKRTDRNVQEAYQRVERASRAVKALAELPELDAALIAELNAILASQIK